MSKQKRVGHKNLDGVEQKHRLRKKESRLISDHYHSWDEGQLSIGETPFWPQVERHTALLAMPLSDEQRAHVTLQLQQNYGNKYVQRVIERSRVKTGLEKSLKTKTSLGTEIAFHQGAEGSSVFAEMSSAIPYIQRMVEEKKPLYENKKPVHENKKPTHEEKEPAHEEKGTAEEEKQPAQEEKGTAKEEEQPTNITELESAIAF